MTYEMLYIIPAPYTEKDVGLITKEINKIVEDSGGKILEEKNLGARVLAYPIKRVRQGFYVLLHFTLSPKEVKSFSANLKLRKDVLRFLIIKKEEGKIRKQRPRRVKPAPVTEVLPPVEEKEKIDLSKIDKEIDKLLEIK